MAISDKEWFVICETLVPGPQFKGNYKDDTFNWTDTRPYPSQAEIDGAIATLEATETSNAAIAAAKSDYDTALAGGYLHTDGVTYYCNERSLIDLCMTVVLNTVNPEEPIYVMSMSHGIVSMSLQDFKNLAVIIGRHAYKLRRKYWEVIIQNS